MTIQTAAEFNRALGAAIRRERNKRGLSMEAVGQSLGFTYQQQGKNELGQNACSAYLIVRYAALFGVSVTYLYEQASINCAVFPVSPSEAEKDAWLVARHVSQIADDEMRGAILHLARSLANKMEQAT